MRSSSPFGAKPECRSASAFCGLSSNSWYRLELISSRAEKELALSADIALAVNE
jgi:hypothetical protein